MSKFTGELDLRFTPVKLPWWNFWSPRWLWTTLEQLPYELGEEGSGIWIVVPKGFTTDGASVPRLFWIFLPAWASYSKAAVLHDHLLTMWCSGIPHRWTKSRRECDLIFLEAMKVCGTSLPVRWVMFIAVRSNSVFKEACRWARQLQF